MFTGSTAGKIKAIIFWPHNEKTSAEIAATTPLVWSCPYIKYMMQFLSAVYHEILLLFDSFGNAPDQCYVCVLSARLVKWMTTVHLA